MEGEGNVIHSNMFGNVIGMPRRAGVGRHYAQFRTPLHIFERGNVTLEQYFREIILDHVRLFIGVISPDFLFMGDNVPHTEMLKHYIL